MNVMKCARISMVIVLMAGVCLALTADVQAAKNPKAMESTVAGGCDVFACVDEQVAVHLP